MEALNDAGEEYGVRVPVSDRVALARALAVVPVGTLTAARITAAFATRGLRPPPAGYATAVVARAKASGATRTLQDELLAYRQ
jgi:hypothetical protein